MSDCLMPYLVSADAINPVFGSKDVRLVGDITAGCLVRIRSLDEWAAEYYDGRHDEEADVEEERLTIEQALGQIVDGDLTTSHFNVYLSAWELVCAHLGDRLPEHWSVRWSWVGPFDELLHRLGLPVRIEDLVYSPPPSFRLPKNPDLGMSVGHWSATDIARSRLLLAKTIAQPDDPEQADTLDALRRWFESAEAVTNPMIVGFCY